MISLIQLEYIVAVDTYRHFATAAQKCFVTQPTLSMQVKKLEEHLDVIIFDRTKQPVIPTEQGKRIISQARIVLQEAKKIDQIVKDVKDEVSGELRIAVIPTIAPYLLPIFTGDFKRRYPSLKLKLEEQVTEKIVENLGKDLLDVGILVTPLHEQHIIEMPLYYEEMLIYSNRDHPLIKKPKIQVNDIATSEIWLLSDGHCFRHQVVNLCDLHDLDSDDLPFEFEGGSLETLMRIIDKEGGYTLIPELAAGTIPEEKQNQIRHFSTIAPLREVSLVFTRRFAKTMIIEKLAKEIKDAVPQHFLNVGRGTVVEWK
jgi:LysR family hydrogen peroxide-inducible transcriptional activator